MARKRRTFAIQDQDHWRAKIQIGMIIETLQRHIKDPGKFPMGQTQVRSAEILLRRALPELQSIEFVGNPDKPITFTWSNGIKTNDLPVIDIEPTEIEEMSNDIKGLGIN